MKQIINSHYICTGRMCAGREDWLNVDNKQTKIKYILQGHPSFLQTQMVYTIAISN